MHRLLKDETVHTVQCSDIKYIVMLRGRSILFKAAMRTKNFLIHPTLRYSINDELIVRPCNGFYDVFLFLDIRFGAAKIVRTCIHTILICSETHRNKQA